MNMTDFDRTCELLPEGVTWGEAITPSIVKHIAEAAQAQQPEIRHETGSESETILKLISTIKYMVGIAERGLGKKCSDDEIPEKFLLDYVKFLEANQAEQEQQVGESRHDVPSEGSELMPRYVIHAGFVTSQFDGDRHYISEHQLISLYNVNPSNCISFESDNYDPKHDDIHLYPRKDGNYTVPSRAVAATAQAQQPALAKHQPCGCVICTCEHETQCQGCGAKNCGTHAVGQMPNPVYLKSQAQQENYKIAIYEKALQDIQNPIKAMQRDLPEGYMLDGMAAIRAADNPQTYKDIASKALQEASLPLAPEGGSHER